VRRINCVSSRYLYEPPFGVFPQIVLRLAPTGFVAETATSYQVIGAMLPLWHHLPELLFESVALAIVPIVAQLLARRRRGLVTIVVWCVFLPLAVARSAQANVAR
jgi:hypothetical protein